MTLLAPAPHLWQVGLAPADGRIVHTAVCPVDVDLTWVLHSLRRTIPGPIAWIPPRGYAHLTLDAGDAPVPLPASIPVSQVAWQAVGVDFTAYSVRLAVEAPVWPDLLASLSLPVRTCYITVGYALERVSVPAEEDLAAIVLQHRLHGVVSRVERRINDPGGAPFRVRTLERVPLPS